MPNPVVSIICTAYNHEPYIRECLDGFMMQQTDFPFEVLIHDDASTDRTADIIREYEDKYPDIIKPIYQTENQYSKGVKIGLTYLYPRAKGKYIAECEGDDYWTDPLKLQKQVDFMEANHEYVICSHNYSSYSEDMHSIIAQGSMQGDYAYNIVNLVEGLWLCHPLTVIYRRAAFNCHEFCKYGNSMDAVLFFHLLKSGMGYYMSENMAVYRLHRGGIWSMKSRDNQRMSEFEARFSIYEVEKSEYAALYVKSLFFKPMNRVWMLKNRDVILRSYKIMSSHLGHLKALKVILGKFLGII